MLNSNQRTSKLDSIGSFSPPSNILFRRIQHDINTLRAQIKHQSLEQISDNIDRYRSWNIRDELSFYPMRRAGSMGTNNRNPYFEDELQTLIDRKNQLDIRIRRLQQSREELTSQLDYLERSSSLSRRSNLLKNSPSRSYSTPTTPIHHRVPNHCTNV